MMGNTKIQLKDNIKELYLNQKKTPRSKATRTKNISPNHFWMDNSKEIRNMNESSLTNTLYNQ